MTNKRGSKDYLYGVPELLILRLLEEREMYGYEIVRGIRERSGEAMNFGEGVIYPLVHSLEKRGLLATRRDNVNGRTRIYYRLNAKGRKALREKVTHWKKVTTVIGNILDGNPDGISPA
ncbi:MAG: helix-turn-helix transcriptional regulator [Planctomycetota bacterium]